MSDLPEDEWPEVVAEDGDYVFHPPTPRNPKDLRIEQVVGESETQACDGKGPYLLTSIQRTIVARSWNSGYNQDAPCECGHPYYRHFDTYEDMYPCGCKYCDCRVFSPKG